MNQEQLFAENRCAILGFAIQGIKKHKGSNTVKIRMQKKPKTKKRTERKCFPLKPFFKNQILI